MTGVESMPLGAAAPGQRLATAPSQSAWRVRVGHVAGRARFVAAVASRPSLAGTPMLLGARSRISMGPQGRLLREAGVVLDTDVHLVVHATMSLGAGVYVGRSCQLVAFAGLSVGEHTRLGERVSIHDEDHEGNGDGYVVAPITIGSNVWIGAGALVLRGSVIGDRAVVAAGAVVRGNVPAGSVVGGVPARVLRSAQGPPPSG